MSRLALPEEDVLTSSFQSANEGMGDCIDYINLL